MKHFTLLVVSLLVSTASIAQNRSLVPWMFLSGIDAPKHVAPARAEAATKYLPAKETEYEYVNGEWKPSCTYSYAYDDCSQRVHQLHRRHTRRQQ